MTVADDASPREVAAAAWVARIDRAPLTASEQAELRAWLDDDVRHPGVFLRAKAVWLHARTAQHDAVLLAPAPGIAAIAKAPARPPRARRPLLAWGAIAASLALCTLVVGLLQAPDAYATARGEMRLVPLGEGATMTLNTATRVEVKDDRRRVRIAHGEVVFDVPRTHGKPVTVVLGAATARSASGTFVVRSLADADVELVVQRGSVELLSGAGQPAVRVVANHRLVLPARSGTVQVADIDPGWLARGLAWREGKIAFEGESLADAARMFARYSDVPLVIEDGRLAHEQVTGLFSANDPVGFGESVAQVFDARARIVDGKVVLDRAH